jgi:phosphoglycolate phosphatase
MQNTAVLFDLDGTLLDTLADLADAMNHVLLRRGFAVHSPEAYKTFIGDGVEILVRRVLPPACDDPAVQAECAAEMRDEYGKRWADKTRPYPGVAGLLDALSARGVSMAVLSNKPHEFTVLCVERLLGRWRFAAVRGAEPGQARKPDPAGALAIAAQLGRAPREVVYLGDTNTDMQTARAAGMFPVGALWGFRTAEELLASGAERLVGEPLELLAVLDARLTGK